MTQIVDIAVLEAPRVTEVVTLLAGGQYFRLEAKVIAYQAEEKHYMEGGRVLALKVPGKYVELISRLSQLGFRSVRQLDAGRVLMSIDLDGEVDEFVLAHALEAQGFEEQGPGKWLVFVGR